LPRAYVPENIPNGIFDKLSGSVAGNVSGFWGRYPRLEFTHPITAGWDWLLRGEFQRQESNLALFDIRGYALCAGVSKTF
jgi:hypothetical protein